MSQVPLLELRRSLHAELMPLVHSLVADHDDVVASIERAPRARSSACASAVTP